MPASEVHRPVDIPALTGLRLFAALAVVAFHLRWLISSIVPSGSAVEHLLERGMLGVDVFFVLSGFVIAHTYAHRLADPAPRARRDYLIARLARIYPLHLVTFSAMVVLVVLGIVKSLDAGAELTAVGFVGNVLMLQALPGIPAWNLPAWSISCELAAYLLFPLFAARLLRIRWGLALALAAAVLVIQLIALYALSSTDLELQSVYWVRIAGEFSAGTLLWVVWSRVLRPGLWGDAAVVLCTLGSVWLVWHGYSWLLAVPLLTALIPAAACATGPIAKLLAHPVTQWGGHISYALYLVHIPVSTVLLVCLVSAGVFTQQTPLSAALVFGSIIAVAIAAAALLHQGVEEPARRWVRRRFVGRSVKPTPGSADDQPGHRGVYVVLGASQDASTRQNADQAEEDGVGSDTLAP